MVVFARDFISGQSELLDAARACSAHVASKLADGSRISLSFEGFRGASSSFFNAFWLDLIDAVGIAGLGGLETQTGSRVLADVIERSRVAAVARSRTRSTDPGRRSAAPSAPASVR